MVVAQTGAHVVVAFKLKAAWFAIGQNSCQFLAHCIGCTHMQQLFGYYFASGNKVWQRHLVYLKQPLHYIVRQFRTVGAVGHHLRHPCQCGLKGGSA